MKRTARKIAILPIRFYQKAISPYKGGPCCRFLPTCSQYAVQAIEERGIIAGCILTVGRVLRCNPLCKGGYDPVPQKGFAREKLQVELQASLSEKESE